MQVLTVAQLTVLSFQLEVSTMAYHGLVKDPLEGQLYPINSREMQALKPLATTLKQYQGLGLSAEQSLTRR